MYRIYLATGNDDLNNFIKQNKVFLENFKKTDIDFVGESLYKGGIVSGVKETSADLVIINEFLNGTEDIKDIIYNLRCECPKTRILFLTTVNRGFNDPLLCTLIQFGVYDFVAENPIQIKDIISKIIKETDFNSIKNYIQITQNQNDRTDIESVQINKKPKVVKKINCKDIKDNKHLEKDNIKPNDDIHFETEDKVGDEIVIEDKKLDTEVTIKEDNNSNKKEKDEIIIDDEELEDEIIIDDKELEDEIIIEEDSNLNDEKRKDEIIIDDEGLEDKIIIEEENDLNKDKKTVIKENNEDKLSDEEEEILIIDDDENKEEEILIDNKNNSENNNKQKEDNFNIEEIQEISIEDKEQEEPKENRKDIKEILKNKSNLEKFPIKNTTIKSNEKDIEILPLRPNLNNEKTVEKNVEPKQPKKNKELKIKKNKNLDIKIKEDLNLQKEEPLKEYNSNNERTSSSGIFGKIFNNKQQPIRSKQIICFCGGNRGVGNSQIAFNTALSLAEEGYKVMYMDLNDRFSSIDCIFQLGFQDAGIDTALYGLQTEEYSLINRSIININKIIEGTEKSNYLYKTYLKMSNNLDYMFFSENYTNRTKDDEGLVNYSYFKDLNYYLTMKEPYEILILDVPCDIENMLTQTALIYSSKIFFTITQDFSVIRNHLNFINNMDKKQISFRDKFYYIINKYENTSFSANEIFEFLGESIKVDSFNIVQIPNLNKELINSNYAGVPLIWNCRNKTFIKTMNFIKQFTLS